MSRLDATGMPRVQAPRTSNGPEAERGEGAQDGPRSRGEGRAGGSEGPARGRPATAADRSAPVPQTREADGTTRNAEETKAPEQKPRDGYQPRGQQSEAGKLRDGAQRPPRALALLMPQTEHFRGQDMKQLAQRFGSDLALLRPDLMPSTLSGKEQAGRLWQFFAAYAEAAAAHGSEDGLEAFREALERAGFLRFKDQGTGRSGLDRAMWGLRAQTAEAVRARMASVELVPMQEDAALPEGSFRVLQEAQAELKQATRQEARAEQQQAARQQPGREGHLPDRPGQEAMLLAVPGQEAQRVNVLAAQAAAAHVVQDAREERLEQDRGRHSRGRDGVLGGNMLFNVLHELRGEGEDSVEAKDRFNRLAFAAVLLLAGATILIVALVSL